MRRKGRASATIASSKIEGGRFYRHRCPRAATLPPASALPPPTSHSDLLSCVSPLQVAARCLNFTRSAIFAAAFDPACPLRLGPFLSRVLTFFEAGISLLWCNNREVTAQSTRGDISADGNQVKRCFTHTEDNSDPFRRRQSFFPVW